MLQPDASSPEVPLRPAPRDCAAEADRRVEAAGAALRTMRRLQELPARPRTGVVPGVVDYAEPGWAVSRAVVHPPARSRSTTGAGISISRILVSTWDSVVNGRANWAS
jgi:hypothetical protein